MEGPTPLPYPSTGPLTHALTPSAFTLKQILFQQPCVNGLHEPQKAGGHPGGAVYLFSASPQTSSCVYKLQYEYVIHVHRGE